MLYLAIENLAAKTTLVPTVAKGGHLPSVASKRQKKREPTFRATDICHIKSQ
jgi:hypothetical protein